MDNVGAYVPPRHDGGNRHIRGGSLKQLSTLTTGNGQFQQLAVSHKTRGGHSQETSVVEPKKYFNVDPVSSFTYKNKFRTSDNTKYRLGTSHSQLCSSIKGKCQKSPESGSEVLKHRGINKCRDSVKAMVENQDKQMRPESSSHMRELLLTETLARQLDEIDGINDRERAGEEIKKTLDWIDSMLASEALTSINVGGELKEEKLKHQENLNSDTKSLAHSVPLVNIESSQSQGSVQHQGTGFPTLNETLMNVREQLIQTELEMAVDSCATEASLKWTEIHGQITSMDQEINQLNSGTSQGLSIVPDSNLDKTRDAIGSKCEQYKESFNDGIEPITQAMTSQAKWTKDVKEAIGGLKSLSSGLAQNCSTAEGRAEWTRELKQWHTKHQNLLLPNSDGKLSKAQQQLTSLTEDLQSIVDAEANKNETRQLNARIDHWSDKALQALELSSDALLSPEEHDHEPLTLHSKDQDRLTAISQKQDKTSKFKIGDRNEFEPTRHKDEYNETVAKVNKSVQQELSGRILKLNQSIDKQAKSTLTTMVNIGLRGHNDYISHLKKHIDDDGCKHLENGGYERLSQSVEKSKQLALEMASHHLWIRRGMI